MTQCYDEIRSIMDVVDSGIDQLRQKLDEQQKKHQQLFTVLANLVALTALYSSPGSDSKSKPNSEKIVKCANGLMKAHMRPSPICCRQITDLIENKDLKDKFHKEMSS